MKIAVTYENGQVFQHFGRTKYFKIYDAEHGDIVSSEIVSTYGQGHGALAQVLRTLQVSALICGGIGGGAQAALAAAGIKIYGGVTGDADAAVAALLSGTLAYESHILCSHHDEEHSGGCHGANQTCRHGPCTD